ncbi:ATP-dependent DNA helicase RecG [bacterium]|nr:ATP-dependent DNA helicase RecG [bacterium]
MMFKSDVQYLKGVGPRKAELLENLGVKTVYDLITYFPKEYEDRRQLKKISQVQDGEETGIQAQVINQKIIYTRKRNGILKIFLTDNSEEVVLVCFNQMYLSDILKKGVNVVLHGKFERKLARLETSNFTYEILDGSDSDLIHTKRIVPIYGLTKGLNIKFLRSLIKRTLDKYADSFQDMLPGIIKDEANLCDYIWAIKKIHFPGDWEEKRKAYRRLIFDEFFLFQLALAFKKKGIKKKKKSFTYRLKRTLLTPFRQTLPFDFTPAQKKVINEIFSDMQSIHPMNRLLQGDVGSGKTVVALAALLLAVENGRQGVIMVPTEILAMQHYINVEKMLASLKIKVELLAGGMGKREKKRICQELKEGKIDIIIGTHSLIQEGIDFFRLGLVVIDEQHKFGVNQRALLRNKGLNPDVLVMTATPIPRTLALTVYGDLDVSTISECPKGRGEIITQWMKDKRAYKKVSEEVKKGRQCYIVYPLVDESDSLQIKAAVKMLEKLKNEIFPDYRVGILHGQMKKQEKKIMMEKFVGKELDILVTTSIIEVGIDVSNATVMVIENSNRFGLSTLHQLRGRIGRGKHTSHCILVGEFKTFEARKRKEVMLATADGFKIAEEDLRLRGPGEFFGTQQHGLPELKIGNIITDFEIIEKTREIASKTLERENLTNSDYSKIKDALWERFGSNLKWLSVG